MVQLQSFSYVKWFAVTLPPKVRTLVKLELSEGERAVQQLLQSSVKLPSLLLFLIF